MPAALGMQMRVVLDMMAVVWPVMMCAAAMPVMSRAAVRQALGRHCPTSRAATTGTIGPHLSMLTMSVTATSMTAPSPAAALEVWLFVFGFFYGWRTLGVVDVHRLGAAAAGAMMSANMAAAFFDFFVSFFVLVHATGGVAFVFHMAHLRSFSRSLLSGEPPLPHRGETLRESSTVLRRSLVV